MTALANRVRSGRRRRSGAGAARLVAARYAVASALGIALACPGARAAEPVALPMAGPWDMVAFEVRSWGRPVTSWRLLRNGSGSWTETVEEPGGRAPRHTAVWHEFEAGEQGYERVARELSRLPLPAPDPRGCRNLMTDLPYGTIRLTRGATTVEIAWNSGCLDADYRAFVGTLKSADSIVTGWGRAGRILRTEPLPPSR